METPSMLQHIQMPIPFRRGHQRDVATARTVLVRTAEEHAHTTVVLLSGYKMRMSFFAGARKYLGKEKFEISRELLISILISALVIASFTYASDRRIDNRIAARQFVYDYGRTFIDNPKYRDLSVAMEDEYLYGKEFQRTSGKKFNDYEVDDYLYLMNDIWSFYKDGFVSKEMLSEQYLYFLCVSVNSPSVQQYRSKLQGEGFTGSHEFLDEASEEFKLTGTNCRKVEV
jgi:hypothetical protein